MAYSMEEIADLLQKTEFKRVFVGGVDEDDVWLKLKKLQNEYAELIKSERQKSVEAINQWKNAAYSCQKEVEKKDAIIKSLSTELEYYTNSEASRKNLFAKPIGCEKND